MNIFAAEAQFDPLLVPYRERADRIMLGMNLFLTLVTLALAPLQDTYVAVLLISVPTLALSYWLVRHEAGTLLARLFMGCGFMAYTGLIIHQTGGEIEGHFSAFGLIGALLYYRDWRTIVAATIFIYLHHLVLGYAQTLGVPVYVFNTPDFWTKFVIHVAYFLPFIGMMCYLAIWLRREGYEGQHVITLAQNIVRGKLVQSDDLPIDDANMPLISAVIAMKNRMIDLLKVMPVAATVIRIDSDTVVSTNHAWAQIFGAPPPESLPFKEWPIWDDPASWERLQSLLHQSKEKLLDTVELTMRNREGKAFLCELSLVLHDETEPAMVIMTIVDITLRRETERTMRRLAYNDMLTGLPNRTSLHDDLHESLKRLQEKGEPFALISLDLDGFKPVNDTHGHDIGDEVLKVVGKRIMHTNREGDFAARLGGDEFVIVVHACDSKENAAKVAQRFVDSIARPILLTSVGLALEIGASAGVSFVDDSAQPVEAIMKQADMALYEAKKRGKSRIYLVDTTLEA